ncbi:MAG TPA: EAL domain-containing protein [Vicinamibacteria bacterium]|jgi:EAL domain-containing protein (putative c-di-GMP-specific phosphodiesterase class I)
MVRFYLESLVEGGRQLRRIVVYPCPFRVGRLSGLSLALASESVSKEHAELVMRDDALHVVDLGSKNGTFVNDERVSEARLNEGDILHFAQVEFRVGRQEFDEAEDLGLEPPTVSLRDMKLPQQFVEGVRQLPELLEKRQVTTLFQPIVTLPSGEVAGYEALGRGCHARLPESPLDLFRVAAAVGAEAELSRLFRENAVELVRQRLRFPTLFVNVHPKELETPTLIPDIVALHERCPQLRLTLDVHEGMLADLENVDRLRTQLQRVGIGIAYDDFGAGQARLLELAEYPPDFLKFDMSFVRGIDVAPESRQRLLRSLVSVARELHVYTVAEGVETAEEADVCIRIGFTHAQGYFFGRPRPLVGI